MDTAGHLSVFNFLTIYLPTLFLLFVCSSNPNFLNSLICNFRHSIHRRNIKDTQLYILSSKAPSGSFARCSNYLLGMLLSLLIFLAKQCYPLLLCSKVNWNFPGYFNNNFMNSVCAHRHRKCLLVAQLVCLLGWPPPVIVFVFHLRFPDWLS